MRKTVVWVSVVLWGLGLGAQPVKGCGCGAKLLLQCDYYVLRKGDLSKREACEKYAESVDIDGASAKAAWYYLAAGKPEKALKAARKAISVGHRFAEGYAAQALAIMGDKPGAEAAFARFRQAVPDHGYFADEVAVLRRLYPDADFSTLQE
jgi:tetratricopeptide (TPR) repeat protein